MRDERGFLIIEVVVSMAIAAIVLTTIFTVMGTLLLQEQRATKTEQMLDQKIDEANAANASLQITICEAAQLPTCPTPTPSP